MLRRVLPLLVLLLFLAGCGGGGFFSQRSNENPYYRSDVARFYQGYEGVEMTLEQLPHRLFYYGNADGGGVRSSANDVPFAVEVHNQGSSYSRGAVFISGYDPNLIMIDEVPLDRTFGDACSFRIGDYSLNNLGFTMQCGDDFFMRGNENNWLESVMIHGSSWFSDSWLSDLRIDYEELANGMRRVDFGFDDITFEMREHGMLLIAVLAGINFEQFNGQDYLLAADNYEYPNGEIDYIDFNAHIVDWPEGTDEIPQTFLATNCYMYTTFAAPMVCIDPEPYAENRKVCRPTVTSGGGGQGAPVAITRIEQENTPMSAIFHIDIRNQGGGTVYDAGSLEKCSPYFPGGTKANDLNVVWIGEVRIGDQRLDCSPQHYVRLHNGQGSFTCNYLLEYTNVATAYETPLVVELWYGYSKVIEKRVVVKRVT